MAARYYTHFVTVGPGPKSPRHDAEWSGVVELEIPIEPAGDTRELRDLLAQTFELSSDEVRILNWARLH